KYHRDILEQRAGRVPVTIHPPPPIFLPPPLPLTRAHGTKSEGSVNGPVKKVTTEHGREERSSRRHRKVSAGGLPTAAEANWDHHRVILPLRQTKPGGQAARAHFNTAAAFSPEEETPGLGTQRTFIPNRSAMDFAYAHYMLTEGCMEEEENPAGRFVSDEAYRKRLREALGMNRTRILAFKNKPPAPIQPVIPPEFTSPLPPSKPRRYIPQSWERKLDAPDLADDYRLNLLDWGSANVLAVALGSTVYLWNASTGSISELVTVDDEIGPVTSVSWAPNGTDIAVGLNNAEVQFWDSTANALLRTLSGGHTSCVGSLAWNNHILTTGGMDGKIINNDMRVGSNIVATFRGHTEEVCGLKWSDSGWQLASGGNDKLLYIWDRRRSTASSTTGGPFLHRLKEHRDAVKALAWCPFQESLLASGGGGGDRCIKFWDTQTGECLNSFDTGSQVCALLWNRNERERELLSSHGLPRNQLTLWMYPSLMKIVERTDHESPALFLAQSPDGCAVASAAPAEDQTLRIWNVFGDPQLAAWMGGCVVASGHRMRLRSWNTFGVPPNKSSKSHQKEIHRYLQSVDGDGRRITKWSCIRSCNKPTAS
ncbi:hypothetical protein CRG98_028369, partial [Punica granatum]